MYTNVVIAQSTSLQASASPRAGRSKPVPSEEPLWLQVLFSLPVWGVGVLAAFLLFFPDAGISFGDGPGELNRLLLLLMVTGMAVFVFGIELDLRLSRRKGEWTEDTRTALAFSTCFALVLFAVWVGITAGKRARVHYLEEAIFVWVLVLATCVPLLWYTARALPNLRHRMLVMAGFLAATVVVELGFDVEKGEPELELMTWHSLLPALALVLRLWSWTTKEFRQEDAPS